MRFSSCLIFILIFSFAQSQSSENLLTNRAPCTFEITKDQLTANKLTLKCAALFENKPFEIENFKIKFKGHATIAVSGNSLNAKSHSLAKKLKVGDYVTIFQIENIILNGRKSQEYKTLIIKIVTP